MFRSRVDSDPYLTPASSKDVRHVAKLALDIWEHPAVEDHILSDVVRQTVNTGFQVVSNAHISLSFMTPNRLYPSFEIVTEETGFEIDDDSSLILRSTIPFIPRRRLFQLPKYQTRGVVTELSIVNEELPDDEDAEALIPKADSWLTGTQLAVIERGRQPGGVIFSHHQAVRIIGLLKEFNPVLLMDIENDVAERNEN